ncbi:MAG: sugar phosphate isomerase/epimerase [Chloroflexota bacterium]|nr:sugar phosphate isomerase/epimerase [Chloroflexota bacterium]
MADVALSTMWGIGPFPTLAGFVRAAHALGFDRFELNHAVNSAMLSGLDLNGFRITSVHEPCPADVSVATLKERDWLISSLHEENRRQGVAAIQRSIDLAKSLGAQVVIVHPGRVDIDPTMEMCLRDLYRAGKAGESVYAEGKAGLIDERARQADRNVAAVRRSLIELAEHAARAGIRLGLENRYHYYEIPSPNELDSLLNLGYDDVVGFWYDVGHAQALDRLGFHSHVEWLRRFAPRIVGVHLHDVVGIDDHRAAGLGEIDWGMVARYLPPDALRTCEFQCFNSPAQVAAGVKWLVEKGCVSKV